jgi:nucleoside-diphosphate-sugar epimerase
MILLTGATGFVGEHTLQQLLDKGYRVRAMYRNARLQGTHGQLKDIHHPNIDWQQGDLNDVFQLEDLLEEVDTVFHTAAFISYDPRYRDQLFETNIRGTANLVNASLHAGVKRMVYVSSIAALGDAPEPGQVIDENASWKTDKSHSNYAISKFMAENEVWRGMEEGLEVIIVNPSVILGAGKVASGSNQLFRKIAEGMRFSSPGGTGFVDVRDVARAMIALHEANLINKRWVLNHRNLPYDQLFADMARVLGVAKPGIVPPRWLAEIGWRLNMFFARLSGKQAFITRETVASAYRLRQFGGTAITQSLPHFSYTAWEETLQAGAVSCRSIG